MIRVPVGFSSYANIVFGRTPLPDESFEGDAPVLTPEEDQRLGELVGLRISDARARLAEWGWTAEYRVGDESREATADQVPGDWYVTDMARRPPPATDDHCQGTAKAGPPLPVA